MTVGARSFFIAAFIVSLLVFTGSWLVVYGHGTGPSIEVQVDEYLLDIGYAPEFVEEGTQTRFYFQILDAVDRSEIDFDDVWVRIEKEDRLYYAGGLGQQRFGATGMTYRFVEAGEYDIYARFSFEGEAIADTTFQFPVTAVAEEKNFFNQPFKEKVILLLIGALAGGLFVWLLRRSATHSHA